MQFGGCPNFVENSCQVRVCMEQKQAESDNIVDDGDDDSDGDEDDEDENNSIFSKRSSHA